MDYFPPVRNALPVVELNTEPFHDQVKPVPSWKAWLEIDHIDAVLLVGRGGQVSWQNTLHLRLATASGHMLMGISSFV